MTKSTYLKSKEAIRLKNDISLFPWYHFTYSCLSDDMAPRLNRAEGGGRVPGRDNKKKKKRNSGGTNPPLFLPSLVPNLFFIK